MDCVIVVYDTDAGELVCVATSVPKAIKYMVDHLWLDDDLPTADWEGSSLQERFGEDWQDELEEMDVDELNELFDDLWFGQAPLIK
jgi:hypothetical protein